MHAHAPLISQSDLLQHDDQRAVPVSVVLQSDSLPLSNQEIAVSVLAGSGFSVSAQAITPLAAIGP
jgi:hypothetical protein